MSEEAIPLLKVDATEGSPAPSEVEAKVSEKVGKVQNKVQGQAQSIQNTANSFASRPPGTSRPVGHQFGLEKVFVPSLIFLNMVVILATLVVAGDRQRSRESSSYGVALACSFVIHLGYVALSFLQGGSGSGVQRLLSDENVQILMFDVIFWMSSPYMWPALVIPLVHSLFQVLDLVPQLSQVFKFSLPNRVMNIVNMRQKKGVVLDYVAITEPLLLLFLVLAIFWNGINSLVPYWLWLNMRHVFSPHTKFAINWWLGLCDRHLKSHGTLAPYYERFRELSNAAYVGRFLPAKTD